MEAQDRQAYTLPSGLAEFDLGIGDVVRRVEVEPGIPLSGKVERVRQRGNTKKREGNEKPDQSLHDGILLYEYSLKSSIYYVTLQVNACTMHRERRREKNLEGENLGPTAVRTKNLSLEEETW
jgi:hypothetical protein